MYWLLPSLVSLQKLAKLTGPYRTWDVIYWQLYLYSVYVFWAKIKKRANTKNHHNNDDNNNLKKSKHTHDTLHVNLISGKITLLGWHL